VKSARRRIRCSAGSTGVRQRGGRGPCGAARTESTDLHACASAGESHGSWPDAGCWAGTYASTRGTPVSRQASALAGVAWGSALTRWSVLVRTAGRAAGHAVYAGGGCRDGGSPHRADVQPPTVQPRCRCRSNRASRTSATRLGPWPTSWPFRPTAQVLRLHDQGGADTPPPGRYGGSRCGQQLDAAFCSR
jgi:hypothetical protein